LYPQEVKLREINPYNVHLLHVEIDIMKTLDHPNIVKLKEVFFETKKVFMVMELCTGGDLELYLRLHGARSETEVPYIELPCASADSLVMQVARLMRGMMSSVNYLHECGIVHRLCARID
jgi:calcium-dependent protein kinase